MLVENTETKPYQKTLKTALLQFIQKRGQAIVLLAQFSGKRFNALLFSFDVFQRFQHRNSLLIMTSGSGTIAHIFNNPLTIKCENGIGI